MQAKRRQSLSRVKSMKLLLAKLATGTNGRVRRCPGCAQQSYFGLPDR